MNSPITKLMTEEYLLNANALKKMGFEVDIFGCYIINEIDKIDEQLSNTIDDSSEYSFLKGKKEALEDLRDAYNIIKK